MKLERSVKRETFKKPQNIDAPCPICLYLVVEFRRKDSNYLSVACGKKRAAAKTELLAMIPIRAIQYPRKHLPRIRFLHLGNLLGRALRDDAAAALAAFGA